MKVARNFTIDLDLIEKMQNINSSELINRLLKDHFLSYNPKNTLLDEKQSTMKQILKKKDRFQKRSRSLRSGINSIWITLLRNGSKQGKAILQFMKSLHTLRVEVSRSTQQNLKKQSISTINSENY